MHDIVFITIISRSQIYLFSDYLRAFSSKIHLKFYGNTDRYIIRDDTIITFYKFPARSYFRMLYKNIVELNKK